MTPLPDQPWRPAARLVGDPVAAEVAEAAVRDAALARLDLALRTGPVQRTWS